MGVFHYFTPPAVPVPAKMQKINKYIPYLPTEFLSLRPSGQETVFFFKVGLTASRHRQQLVKQHHVILTQYQDW